ncbi:MAG: 50S ribosomal protein L15 [Myxococcota bacterium]
MSGELSKLQMPPGANRANKRKGKGLASGQGKTAGRGMKGQKARKSGNVRPGFEGGQMPIQRRLPKTGFVPMFPNEWAEVAIDRLNRFPAGSLVDEAALREKGLVKGVWTGVKVLGGGTLNHKVDLKVNRITKGAKETVEKLGGKVELIADRQDWQRTDTRTARRAQKKK